MNLTSPKFILSTSLCALAAYAMLSLASVMAADAKAVDPTGTWKWTTQRQNADPVESVLKLKREGDQLTGTVANGQGREIAIKDATIKGNEIAFKVERRGTNGQNTESSHTGKITGDKIEGQITIRGGKRDRTREWTATRASTAADPSGKWDFTLETPDQNYNAVLELKRDGDKLAGRIQADTFELPISEGKIAGDTVTWTTTRDNDDGTKQTYKSTGKISGNNLTGKVDFTSRSGEARSLNWTAKRK